MHHSQVDFYQRRDAAIAKAHADLDLRRRRAHAMPAFILLAGVVLAVIAVALSAAAGLS